jgi:hypothetical protein
MDDRSFDTLTRQATGGTSRRGSMMTLAAAGFVAALATPFMAAAKEADAEKKRGKKKHKNSNQNQIQPAPLECPPLPVDLCPGQVQPCTDTFTAVCGGNPDCQDAIPCCSHLETCDFSGWFSCLVSATA